MLRRTSCSRPARPSRCCFARRCRCGRSRATPKNATRRVDMRAGVVTGTLARAGSTVNASVDVLTAPERALRLTTRAAPPPGVGHQGAVGADGTVSTLLTRWCVDHVDELHRRTSRVGLGLTCMNRRSRCGIQSIDGRRRGISCGGVRRAERAWRSSTGRSGATEQGRVRSGTAALRRTPDVSISWIALSRTAPSLPNGATLDVAKSKRDLRRFRPPAPATWCSSTPPPHECLACGGRQLRCLAKTAPPPSRLAIIA